MANLVDDHKFTKFSPTNFSYIATAIIIKILMNMNLPFHNANFEVAISSVLAIKRITHRKQRAYNQARHSNL